MKTKKRIICITGIISNILLILLMGVYLQYEKSNIYQMALDDAERNGIRIQNVLEDSVKITMMAGREILLVHEQGDLEDRIEEILESYYEINGDTIDSIQYAPDGVVTYICPEEGNENAYINLFEAEDRKEEALYSASSGQVVIAGPYDLRQGGKGLIIRYPLYEDGEGIGMDSFIGFSVVVLKMDAILDNFGFFTLDDRGYDYYMIEEVPGEDGEIEKVDVIENSGIAEISDAAEYTFAISNYTFHLYIYPEGGWHDISSDIAIFLVAEIILILIFALLWNFIRLREKTKQLEILSTRDALTGLKNRQAMRNEFTYYLRRPMTMVMLDIDDFKQVNDNYGHEMGDVVLKEVAAKVSEALPDHFVVYRFGGDEFLVYVLETDEDQIVKEIDHIVAHVDAIHISDYDRKIRISFGYATGYCENEAELRELRKRADERLYEMKRERKG